MTRTSPHGPFALTARRQVTVPKALLDQLGLGPGDQVQFAFDDATNEIVLIPDSRVGSALWNAATQRAGEGKNDG